MRVRSADLLVKNVLSDPAALARLPTDASEVLNDAADKAIAMTSLPDTWIYRIVVGSLGLVALIVVVGYIAHAMNGGAPAIPDGVIAIGSAAVGALAGLLAPSPGGSG